MKRAVKILFILFVLLIAAAAIVFFGFRKRLVKSILPTVEEVYIQNLHIENGVGHAHLVLSLENKDVTSYQMSSVDISLSSGQVELMKYQSDSSYTLAAGEKKSFDLEFEINTKQLVKRIRNLQDKDSANITLKGNIIFDVFWGNYKLDIDKQIKVRVPTPPDIKIREIEYLGIRGGDSLDFNLHIGVFNYNPNIIGIRNTTYRFIATDFIEAEGNLPDIVLDTTDTIVSIVPVTFVTRRKLELLSRILLKNDPVEYELVLDGVLLHNNEKRNEISITVVKKDKLVFDKKKNRSNASKIKFTNKRKKERKQKRQEKRRDSDE